MADLDPRSPRIRALRDRAARARWRRLWATDRHLGRCMLTMGEAEGRWRFHHPRWVLSRVMFDSAVGRAFAHSWTEEDAAPV